jgi:alpha-glucosidase (family GH31 glycosyl hydrolase)
MTKLVNEILCSVCNYGLFTFFFIFTFSSGPLRSQTPFSGQQQELSYDGNSYSVRIVKSPFQIIVDNHINDVIKITGIVPDPGAEGNGWKTASHSTENNVLHLTLSGEAGRYFTVDILLKVNGLRISLLSADRSNYQRIGFRFDTKTSGHWYGGAVVKAHMWPLEADKLKVDPFFATSNQASPVWYTSSGAGILADTYSTMGYGFNDPQNGIFEVFSKNDNRLDLEITVGKNIRDAFYKLAEITGKPSVVPPMDYFAYPQFNTWIEFFTSVNQDGIMKYVEEIRKNNIPSKLFIIDDKWTPTYGDPEFDVKKFPEPEKMISILQRNNFKIALWLTPFIEKNAKNFQYAADHHYLIMNPDNASPYFARWWNGTAALVDLSNPEAYSWFLGLMKDLQNKYGVDGFKLDAGDAEYLSRPFLSYGKITANEYTDLFAGLGTNFEANELRVSWRTQSMGLIQRLRDKAPVWGAVDGINSLIPHALCAGLIGYSFVCPDIIGGGLDEGFKNKGYKFDEELFVRWTETSALMPMMQYSLAPWKLSPENIAICRKYSELHVSLGGYIYRLAEQSRIDGSPIVRPLFFEFPGDEKTYTVRDEFMLGERFLVAPVLVKGAVSRKVYLPGATWVDFWTGNIIKGGQSVDYPAPLDVLPVFIRIE